MQNNIEPEEELPKGVILRDFDDFGTLRNQIFDGVKNSMIKSFPVDYGNVRMELHDVDYDEREDVPVSHQKKMLLENKYITKKLRGTIKLFDKTNDQMLEEKRVSLMKVPYLTNRGTFIHGGNEYASIMQSRLLPGVYTRRQANGELETQFNVKPGTGVGFRVGFEPETTQYRVKISQANLHLYSLLKDLGTDDKELEKAWGPEIFRANQMKYDVRVFDKAYDRLVPARQKKLDKTKEDKVASVRSALDAAQIHARVAQKNLPNMFDPKIASQWEAQWQGKQAAEKRIEDMSFNPDLEPNEALENYVAEELFKRADRTAFTADSDKEASMISGIGSSGIGNLAGALSSATSVQGLGGAGANLLETGINTSAGITSAADLAKTTGSVANKALPATATRVSSALSSIAPKMAPALGSVSKAIASKAGPAWAASMALQTGKVIANPQKEINNFADANNAAAPGVLGYAQRAWQGASNPPAAIATGVKGVWDAGKAVYDAYKSNIDTQQATNNYYNNVKSSSEEIDKFAADMRALMQARTHSAQAKEEYKKKTAIMAAALARYPEEFIVDQNGRMSGITHLPTGFRIHVPREVIPKNVKRVFQEDLEDE